MEEMEDVELEPIGQEGELLSDICEKARENFPQIPFSALTLSVYSTGSFIHQWNVLRISYQEPARPKFNSESNSLETSLEEHLTLYEVMRVASRFQSFDPKKNYLCWNEKKKFFLQQKTD